MQLVIHPVCFRISAIYTTAFEQKNQIWPHILHMAMLDKDCIYSNLMYYQVSMKVNYANNHKWVKKIHPDIFPDFGKSSSKKIQKLLKLNERHPHTQCTFKPLDELFLDWFIPFYHEKINKKDNPNPHDVYATTLGKSDAKYTYYALTLSEEEIVLGGAIFTLREDRLSIVYRAFEDRWEDEKLPGSPSLLAEYELTRYCLEHEKQVLVHGSDRNPYGINSGIGVATFKLSIGCQPELQKTYVVDTIDLGTVTQDVLVMELPEQGTKIVTAHLSTTHEQLHKYTQLLSYSQIIDIVTHIRKS